MGTQKKAATKPKKEKAKQTQSVHTLILSQPEKFKGKVVKNYGNLKILISKEAENGIEFGYQTVSKEIKEKGRFFKATEDYNAEIYKTKIIKGNEQKNG